MLRVDLRALAAGPLDTVADLPQDDPGLADLEFQLLEPVGVTGRITASGQDSYYWEGRIRTRVRAACRRCLEPTEVTLDQPVRLLFTEDDSADDPGVVVIPRNAADLDLTEAVREELILAAPEFPLCREDCKGLCPRCGADLNQGPCGCRPGTTPRWKALDVARHPDDETR
ncbi:MAG TPA: DUF177 domain-containing protein [Gemmatimonadales bacterium]|nr:DUF177 domain-containing protein [Gemmatimonadales bacterium]